jgi:tetratricopeptide (TPR) repeat protein
MSLRDLLSNKGTSKSDVAVAPAAAAAAPATKRLPLEEGLEHLKLGRYDHAIVALRLALQREPGRFAAVRGLATAYLLGGEPKAARRVLETFTAEHPMAGEGWRLAAQLEWKLSYRTRAVEILYAGLKRLPLSQMLHRQLAVFLAAEGKTAEAAQHVGSGGSKVAEYVAAANGEVAALPEPAPMKLAPVTSCDHDWLDQIAEDPVLLNAILAPLSTALTDQSRQMLQAIEWKLARLLEAQPNHADRQLLLARLQARLDMVPAAMLSLQRAMRANPNLAAVHRLKSELHARIGEVDQAIEILKDLLKRGLAWPDVHFEIAELERQRGRDAEARSHLYSAIRINPDFEQARDLLDRMAA